MPHHLVEKSSRHEVEDPVGTLADTPFFQLLVCAMDVRKG